MKFLLRNRHGEVVVGDTLAELAVAAGVQVIDRKLRIEGRTYHSYSDEFTVEEMYREAAKDGIRKLRSNHGWTFYKEVE